MKFSLVFISFMILISCRNSDTSTDSKAIARVDNVYLYADDLKDLVAPGTPKKDSLAIVKDFINRWATQQLLFKKAEINLNKDKQKEFEKLLEQYKIDLYTKAYLEEMVIRTVDTTITETDLETYYAKYKNNFKTTDDLVRLRFINISKSNTKMNQIKAYFGSGKPKDKENLKKIAINFKNYALNDSVWVDMPQVYEKLPFVNQDNKLKYIQSGVYFQYQDSTDIFLVKVLNVAPKNSISPYQYIKPTLKQIIINERKNNLIQQLKKEITDDALNNDDYEIYK